MKTPEAIMDGYDMSTFTEQQKSDYAEYGLLPGGPVWDNFNVCDAKDYICTFEYVDRRLNAHGNGKYKTYLYVADLYLIRYDSGDYTVLLRENEQWEGSYGSMDLSLMIASPIPHQPYKQVMQILRRLGRFTWTLGK